MAAVGMPCVVLSDTAPKLYGALGHGQAALQAQVHGDLLAPTREGIDSFEEGGGAGREHARGNRRSFYKTRSSSPPTSRDYLTKLRRTAARGQQQSPRTHGTDSGREILYVSGLLACRRIFLSPIPGGSSMLQISRNSNDLWFCRAKFPRARRGLTSVSSWDRGFY